MLELSDISLRFGATTALDGVSLRFPPETITAILGPSGSGKTTLLRVVAGLAVPDSGTVTWQGEDLAPIPPHRRRFGLVFQDYALFPHRTVADNVAFGLRMRGDQPAAIADRVREVLDWVGLAGFEGRSVTNLSGGEQQRVALARALAPEPRLLMFDEPVGSLDRLLRERLVGELGAILRERGITALYVTHDQDEAMALADQLVIMREGKIVQTGTPAEVWARPASRWVAEFLGFENVIDGWTGVIDGPAVIHAEAVRLGDGPFEGTITGRRFHGSTVLATVTLPDGLELIVKVAEPPEIGVPVRLSIDPAGVVPLAR